MTVYEPEGMGLTVLTWQQSAMVTHDSLETMSGGFWDKL